MSILKLCEQLCPGKIPVILANKLGAGVDGEVFEIDNNPFKVIKLCLSYDLETNPVISYLVVYHLPTYAHVYECGHLFENENFILHYYIMEKLFPITEDESKVFHTIISHEDRNIIKNYSLREIKKILNGLSRGLDFDEKRVTFLCENLKKNPVHHLDLHSRNIMKDAQGNFKLVDFDRCKLLNI
jgi:serine/threonine protein kinase